MVKITAVTEENETINLPIAVSLIINQAVDIPQCIVDHSGTHIKITARSKASLLTDNEALPIYFRNASDDVLFSKYLQPLGFTEYIGDSRCVIADQNVTKGITVWQVMEQ